MDGPLVRTSESETPTDEKTKSEIVSDFQKAQKTTETKNVLDDTNKNNSKADSENFNDFNYWRPPNFNRGISLFELPIEGIEDKIGKEKPKPTTVKSLETTDGGTVMDIKDWTLHRAIEVKVP